MRHKIKHHGKYVIGIWAEKLWLIGDIIILIRWITGDVMWHPLSSRERFCYIIAWILWLLSFIVPIILHGSQILLIFQNFARNMEFWRWFGQEVVYVSIWYTILTTISRWFYIMSKPTQIKKVISYRKNQV